ncbi:hypothetical protein FMM56_05410 [Campylobacter sp. LR264d]|nr:hypothetical protein FMM56_05410 [Campylobacter sp. LR264d]
MVSNIILLGGSNCVMVNGLQKGIKEVAKEKELNFYNFSLGYCTSLQNLYELIRHKEIFANASLIITESNVNEIYNNQAPREKLPLNLIARYIFYYYRYLHSLQKKVVVLILPFYKANHQIINNLHILNANNFGFNIINLQKAFSKMNLIEFANMFEVHQPANIMAKIGKLIMTNLKNYHYPKKIENNNNIDNFLIIKPSDMINLSKKPKENIAKNSAFEELTYRLDKDISLKFPPNSKGYRLAGLHSWNESKKFSENVLKINSSIYIKNKKYELVKEMAALNLFCEILNTNFIVDDESIVSFNDKNKPNTEYFHACLSNYKDSKKLAYFDLIAFFLIKDDEENIDFTNLNKQSMLEERDFTNLIINNTLYEEVINACVSLIKQNKINESISCNNFFSYKLGQALIKAYKNRYKGGFFKFIFELRKLKKDYKLN